MIRTLFDVDHITVCKKIVLAKIKMLSPLKSFQSKNSFHFNNHNAAFHHDDDNMYVLHNLAPLFDLSILRLFQNITAGSENPLGSNGVEDAQAGG